VVLVWQQLVPIISKIKKRMELIAVPVVSAAVPVPHFVLQAKNVWQTMIVNPRTAMVLLCCVKLVVVVTEFIMETKDVLMEEKIV
tara:strand:+ start:532 stop:786 length:255 start_codon:yes stop_codon:yes gene_type:complete